MLSHFSCVQLFATPWTIACQAPLSMEVFRQEYWSGLSCPPTGDLPNPGIESVSPATPAFQADSLLLSLRGSPHTYTHTYISATQRPKYLPFTDSLLPPDKPYSETTVLLIFT